MNEDRLRRDMHRIDEIQRRADMRLAQQQARVNARFEKMRERVDKKYGRPNISQQRIIDAALTLLQQDGLNNLSLRKLAAQLDMQAPALYWHFKNKDVLI